MPAVENITDSKRLTCPICSSTFFNIFPSGECQTCFRLVCGHCIEHGSPDHKASICQDCVEKATPYGQVKQMDPDELLQALQDPSSKNSTLVARLFGDRKDKTAVTHLCQALNSDRIDVRREAAVSLGKIGDPGAIPGLLHLLHDPVPAVRGRAALSLAELEAKEALPQLEKQVDDPSRQAAGFAVQALGKIMGSDVCELLEKWVLDHQSSFVRCEALTVLAGFNHEMALAAAMDSLDDPKKEVVITAIKTLAKLNDLEAAPRLENLIEKTYSATIRINAKTTLHKLLNP